jgi:hypothetical protein
MLCDEIKKSVRCMALQVSHKAVYDITHVKVLPIQFADDKTFL